MILWESGNSVVSDVLTSVIGIIKELEKRNIFSPTGKEKWCKRTIHVMLSNEKYMGESSVEVM